MKVQKSIDIAVPRDKVWPYLSEPEKILTWYLPLQKFEYTSDVKNQVGAPLYFEENVAGRTIKLQCKITEWQENEVVAFEMASRSSLKVYGGRWTLAATPSGTTFTFQEHMDLPYGILGKIAGPIGGLMSGMVIRKMLARLKELTEAE